MWACWSWFGLVGGAILLAVGLEVSKVYTRPIGPVSLISWPADQDVALINCSDDMLVTMPHHAPNGLSL